MLCLNHPSAKICRQITVVCFFDLPFLQIPRNNSKAPKKYDFIFFCSTSMCHHWHLNVFAETPKFICPVQNNFLFGPSVQLYLQTVKNKFADSRKYVCRHSKIYLQAIQIAEKDLHLPLHRPAPRHHRSAMSFQFRLFRFRFL